MNQDKQSLIPPESRTIRLRYTLTQEGQAQAIRAGITPAKNQEISIRFDAAELSRYGTPLDPSDLGIRWTAQGHLRVRDWTVRLWHLDEASYFDSNSNVAYLGRPWTCQDGQDAESLLEQQPERLQVKPAVTWGPAEPAKTFPLLDEARAKELFIEQQRENQGHHASAFPEAQRTEIRIRPIIRAIESKVLAETIGQSLLQGAPFSEAPAIIEPYYYAQTLDRDDAERIKTLAILLPDGQERRLTFDRDHDLFPAVLASWQAERRHLKERESQLKSERVRVFTEIIQSPDGQRILDSATLWHFKTGRMPYGSLREAAERVVFSEWSSAAPAYIPLSIGDVLALSGCECEVPQVGFDADEVFDCPIAEATPLVSLTQCEILTHPPGRTEEFTYQIWRHTGKCLDCAYATDRYGLSVRVEIPLVATGKPAVLSFTRQYMLSDHSIWEGFRNNYLTREA